MLGSLSPCPNLLPFFLILSPLPPSKNTKFRTAEKSERQLISPSSKPVKGGNVCALGSLKPDCFSLDSPIFLPHNI